MSKTHAAADFLQSREYAAYRQELAERKTTAAAQDKILLAEAEDKTFNQAIQIGTILFMPGVVVGAAVGLKVGMKEVGALPAVPIIAPLCGAIAAATLFVAAVPVTAAVHFGKYAWRKASNALSDFHREGDKMGEAVDRFRQRLDTQGPAGATPV